MIKNFLKNPHRRILSHTIIRFHSRLHYFIKEINFLLHDYNNFFVSRLLQGGLLMQNPSAGIIMSTQSLVLQRIERENAGNYTCRAINLQGETDSPTVNLRVQCKCYFLFSRIFIVTKVQKKKKKSVSFFFFITFISYYYHVHCV